jgi:hypothetical protein
MDATMMDIFDGLGRLVRSRSIQPGEKTIQVDLAGEAAGLYRICVRSEGGTSRSVSFLLE